MRKDYLPSSDSEESIESDSEERNGTINKFRTRERSEDHNILKETKRRLCMIKRIVTMNG